jgi:hypothetical protein
MVTLEQTALAMDELIGDGTPNGKLALFAAVTSIHTSLTANKRMVSVLRQYVDRPLPVNRDVLRKELCNPFRSIVNTLYEVEKLWNVGLAHFNCGDTFELQSAWRLSMCALIPGMGMKTVSFALHIYAPKECLLLTIDVWHERRMQSVYGRVNARNYVKYENLLYKDIVTLAYLEGSDYSPIVYAACLWERTRQAASGRTGAYQSHAGLSCYC